MRAYGYNIEQILMIDIIPDASVRKAMNEINAGASFTTPFLLFSVGERFLFLVPWNPSMLLGFSCVLRT